MSNSEEFAKFPESYWSLFCFFSLNANSHSLTKEESSHTVLETLPWWFLWNKLDDSGLFSTQAFSGAQLSTVGRASCTSKGPLLFPSLFLFLMGSKMEERMLSNSRNLMILCFLQIWHLVAFRGGDLFFSHPIFNVCMLSTGTREIPTVLI